MTGPGTAAQPSLEMQEILDWLAEEDAGLADPTTLPAEQGRAQVLATNQRWNQDLPAMRRTDCLSFDAADGRSIPAKLFTPEVVEPGLIYYVHGGGFAFCDIGTHERFTRLLAIETRCPVLSVNYRLAPEHRFPAGLEDCISVFRQLDSVQQTYDWTRGPVTVSGDSAGANIALCLMLQELQLGRSCADFAMLFYGVFGADFDTTSYRRYEQGPGLTRAKMMRYWEWYADIVERNNPLAVPLLAADELLQCLPPLFFNAAEIDPLCSDTELLVKRLHALGRRDQFQLVSGVVHGFLQMSLHLPAACGAISDAAKAYHQFAGEYHKTKPTRSPR